MTCKCGADLPTIETTFDGVVYQRHPEMCHACRVSSAERMAAAADRAQMYARVESAGIPPGVVVFESFRGVVDHAVETLERCPLVWVCGAPRSGRTTLAAAVAIRWLGGGKGARYDHASLMSSKEGWAEGRERWQGADLLVMDGLFDTRSAMPAWLLDHLDGLLQQRADGGRRTLLTSTKSLDEVARHVDAVLAARMADMAGDDGEITLPARRGGA